ncbi:MAG TPA: hypothetical protein VH062_32245 [Polyangiaceae bacterium]|jgi:hypothetical protein|nr:hypothetical protein [Polyangiaceae bacterium]
MRQLRKASWVLVGALGALGCGSSSSATAGSHGEDGGAQRASGGGYSDGTGASGSLEGGAPGGDMAAGGSSSGVGGSASGLGGTAADSGGATGTAGSPGTGPKIPVGSTQCSDGIDNDGDGLIDSADPECTGALDNDESSFATGIPGDNVDPKWQDCFFDGNSGGGDDGCRYSTGCLTGELSPTDKSCAVSATCRKNCMPLTPNGCDCFGCCAVKGPGGDVTNVFIQSSCTYADLGDPKKCPTCTPSAACDNTCDHCELCLGKTSLPADCAPGTGGAGGAGGAPGAGGAGGACVAPVCAQGQQSCGVACLPDCAPGYYCLTGCCVPNVR